LADNPDPVAAIRASDVLRTHSSTAKLGKAQEIERHLIRLHPILWPAALAIVAAGSFVGGRFWSVQRPIPPPSAEAVAAAQRSSSWGLNPTWIDLSGEEALFRQVRARAFASCFRDGSISRTCAEEQDAAVQSVVLTLEVVEAQRRMPDRGALGVKERWVADHPEIVSQARSYCWALYNSHGGMDARLLAVCLGNLIEGSIVVPLPTRD
jgi:hypothetical protein